MCLPLIIKWLYKDTVIEKASNDIITHSQREAYMDLVENSGGGGRHEIVEPQGM